MSRDIARFTGPSGGRRSFLKGAGVVGAGVVGTALLTPSKSQAQVDDPAYLKLSFNDILRHKNAHVAALQDLITSLGGTPRPKPVFRDITEATELEFLRLARTVVNLSVGAYMGVAPLFFNRDVLEDLLAVALIEGRHAGWVNHLVASELTNVRRITANVYGLEQTFERALSRQEVLDVYLEYHQTLNGGPALFYSITPSPTNDINILNFLLALEFLQQDVFAINVPVFYP
jgi:hypothetical protein